jgi:hypothetical protein
MYYKFYRILILTIFCIACISVQNSFSQNLSPELKIHFSNYSDTIIPSNISYDLFEQIFEFLDSKSNIIDYKDCNICKSRAHILCRVIEKHFPEINIYKVWLFADSKRSSKSDYYKYAPNYYLGFENCKFWKYHVAPVLLFNSDTIVIDPATQNKHVKLSEWINDITPDNSKAFLIIKKPVYYLFPEDENNLFADHEKVWDLNNPRLTDTSFTRSINEISGANSGFYNPWIFNFYEYAIRNLIE